MAPSDKSSPDPNLMCQSLPRSWLVGSKAEAMGRCELASGQLSVNLSSLEVPLVR
jgi:hypothetical protein